MGEWTCGDVQSLTPVYQQKCLEMATQAALDFVRLLVVQMRYSVQVQLILMDVQALVIVLQGNMKVSMATQAALDFVKLLVVQMRCFVLVLPILKDVQALVIVL